MMSAPAPYPMVQSSAPAIDDHEITTRTPSICVDYLSHNWTDEDVWSSWKAMTKRKNEIANGVRLENASWRTWAKQRGKLKTISPETLNWLKDSDVTWLYGPLHEHAEPVPPPKQATARERLGLEDSTRTKSILKHRTISEMLTTPGRNATSPSVETPPNGGSGASSVDGSDTEGEGHLTPSASSAAGRRPGIIYTKSETALSNVAHANRGGSPPGSVRLLRNAASSGDKGDGIAPTHEERRHISFNQRVDQCIAVDTTDEDEDDDEAEYSDGMYDTGRQDEDGSSSDEEVLTMKSSPRTAPAWPTMASSRHSSLVSFEHHTIAKLAPTLLKTSDTYPAPSPQVVDPTGFSAHLNGTDASSDAGRVGNADRQPRLSAQPQLYGYDHQDEELGQTRYSQWDADDDFNGDFDYFNGPDVHDGYHTPSHRGDDTVEAAPSAATESTGEAQAAPAPPRSILKRRPVGNTEEDNKVDSPVTKFSPPSSPETSQQSFGSSPTNTERGRPSQRMGSSASYERLQDAARGTVSTPGSSAAGAGGRTRSSSANGSVYDPSEAVASSSSSLGSSSASSPPLASAGRTHGNTDRDRRDSFRNGKAGDSSRIVAGSARRGIESELESEGRISPDFNSPGYPASPQLGDKDDDSDSGDEDKLYGRKKDAKQWADHRGKQSRRGGPVTSPSSKLGRSAGEFEDDAEDEDEPGTRLSVDLENLPSNTQNSPGSAPGGPTPLNTPTFALARSRGGSGGKRGGSGSAGKHAARAGAGESNATADLDGEDNQARQPDSPLLPRRSSATGALVAPSHADKDAGVRVPLAHDYVEEDEGGIVGRAVEIVNTARDLIGALLGPGGDRGRSWREGN